ncbi:sensor histidine kinase [Paenibacillus thailandensis]|uniref:Sensor histidine kinase n=1 Tax=Paenibacillus thailandensis TaxID=393250 RepID=A0ABW5QW30_9BACL
MPNSGGFGKRAGGVLAAFIRWLELNNWPIRYKYILLFAMIGIVPAVCLGLLIGWAVGATVDKQVNEHTAQLIGNVNESLDNHVSNVQNITYFIAFNPDIQRFLDEGSAAFESEQRLYETKRFLQGFTTLYPEIAGILVVSAKGDYLSNEMYARTDRPLTEEIWYREAVDGKGIFRMLGHPAGRNVTSHANYKDDEVVSAVRAVLDPDTQRPDGVVLIDLKLRVIAETVRDVRLGKSGFLTVVDASGDTIYAPRGNADAAGFSREPLLGADSGVFTEEVQGKRMQLIFQKSSFTGWTTVGVFPLKESVREIRHINAYLVSFVFLLCLLGIAASYYLSHSISRPIVQLASFMRKVEEGNMNIRYISKRQDEVGMLGRSFNTMLAQINRLIGQVGEEQRLKREAELRSLQAHIQPHFLYNTLDTIQWLARKDGAVEAAEVVESLSRLFRIGLSKGKEIVPLQSEIDHIESYLRIQKTRYKDKLNYSIDVEAELPELQVLKIMLQPIVENAIYHGIKERRGPGFIRIRAELEQGRRALLLIVEDDGKGMPADRLDALRRMLDNGALRQDREEPAFAADLNAPSPGSTGGSYGLANVQERLRLSFGEHYGIALESEIGRGTKVTIRHPIIRKEAYAE